MKRWGNMAVFTSWSKEKSPCTQNQEPRSETNQNYILIQNAKSENMPRENVEKG
ncbi:MAG: hypothetical protein H6536_02770 [Bacteroidales bacterium]|nr:hypothetical protein [Bacteroidales bacterium]